MATIIEGTWEEVRAHESELRGRRLRVVVLPDTPATDPFEQALTAILDGVADLDDTPHDAGVLGDRPLQKHREHRRPLEPDDGGDAC